MSGVDTRMSVCQCKNALRKRDWVVMNRMRELTFAFESVLERVERGVTSLALVHLWKGHVLEGFADSQSAVISGPREKGIFTTAVRSRQAEVK